MSATTRIIGIDPGLRNMGWGVIESDGIRLRYLGSGTIHSTSTDDLAERLLQLYEGLKEALYSFKPDEAAVEQTFVNAGATSTLKLGQARGVAMLTPAMAGLKIAEYAPNQVKKTVTGVGHSDKKQIRAMIGYLLPKARPETDDEADALAIAICHAQHRGMSRIAKQLRDKVEISA